MALVFMDGFDKYGPGNTGNSLPTLMAGEWNSVSSVTIVTGLSAVGYAITIQSANVPLSKNLTANYPRLIGGFRFANNLISGFNAGISFLDAGTAQCSLTINSTIGTISLRNGGQNGTAAATSAGSIIANSVHYLEWDITFSNTGSYQVWLDGVNLFSGTADMTTTTNNFCNQIQFVNSLSSSVIMTIDDFYLFDTTGTTNNAVLLTSPRIETTFPASDNTVQFAVAAAALGSPVSRSAQINALVAPGMFLRRFTTSVICTLNSIGVLPVANAPTINWRALIYADNGSGTAPTTLIASGPAVMGAVSGVVISLPLTTPPSLSANTMYWLGFMQDATLNMAQIDNAASGFRASVTFTSGAPPTAPAMSGGQPTFVVWGNVSGITGNNWYGANQQPPAGLYNYVSDSIVGHEDLYNFPALSTPPAFVYAVAVKGYLQRSDTGSRTISLRTRSGATDGGGNLTGQNIAPGSFNWFGSGFETNPNTGTAWTPVTLNAAQSGIRIDS